MASFAYLKNLPVDYLKIDGMFVRDVHTDPLDRALVRSINDVGKVMGKKTIAEFVENDEIMRVLAEVGVDFAQGYGVGNTVLLTARGKRWNADSLSQAFHRERDALGLGDKNFHDLRGTAATRFVKAGLSDVEVAEIMGWAPSRIHDIRRKYVDRRRVNEATAAKLDAFEKATAAASM